MTLTLCSQGTVILQLRAAAVTDTATNANAVTNGPTVTVDRTGPTVTINQAAAQADPTGVEPINFTVVFNESVLDFATGDVTLSGHGRRHDRDRHRQRHHLQRGGQRDDQQSAR